MRTHLPQLEAHVADAATRLASRQRWWRRSLGRPAALGMFGALVVAGGAGAVVLSGGSVDPGITAKLAVLRDERTPADDIGALGERHQAAERRAAAARAADPAMARRAYGRAEGGETLNFAASRRVRSNVSGLNLWLVPRAEDSAACLISQSGDAYFGQIRPCMERRGRVQIGSGRLLEQMDVGSPPTTLAFATHTDLLGIVPDGVTRVRVRLANGSEHTVTVVDNVYSARFTTPTLSVSYWSPAGPVTLPARSG